MMKALEPKQNVEQKLNNQIKQLITFSNQHRIAGICVRLEHINSSGSDRASRIIGIRNDLLKISCELEHLPENSQNKKLLDAIFNVLVLLAELSPMNNECIVSWKPIDASSKIYLSIGYQFDINYLVAFINQKKEFLDPYSNDFFSTRDIKRIVDFSNEKKLEITAPTVNSQEDLMGNSAYFSRSLLSFFFPALSSRTDQNITEPATQQINNAQPVYDCYDMPLEVLREYERQFQEEDEQPPPSQNLMIR